MEIELDIWNNVTKFKDGKFWVKQKFMGDELLEYEDSDGNHWVPEYGIDNPFATYNLELEYGYDLDSIFLENKLAIQYSINNSNIIVHDFDRILCDEFSLAISVEIDKEILKNLKRVRDENK